MASEEDVGDIFIATTHIVSCIHSWIRLTCGYTSAKAEKNCVTLMSLTPNEPGRYKQKHP